MTTRTQIGPRAAAPARRRMAAVHSDFLAATLQGFQTRFYDSWNRPGETDRFLRLADRIPSTNLEEVVPFTGGFPRPQKVTKRHLEFADVDQFSLTVRNEEWQLGFAIRRAVFEDDRLGLYARKPDELAESHKRHIGLLIAGMFEDTTVNAYDGNALFHDTREIGDSGVIDNILAGGWGGTPSVSEFLAALRQGQEAMLAFKTNAGENMGILPNTVIAPPKVFTVALEALATNSSVHTGAEKTAVPVNGVFTAGPWTVVLNDELTDADAFYLAHVDPELGRFPFVWTDRTPPALDGTTSTDSIEWREHLEARYTTYGRYQVGAGEPRFIVRLND